MRGNRVVVDMWRVQRCGPWRWTPANCRFRPLRCGRWSPSSSLSGAICVSKRCQVQARKCHLSHRRPVRGTLPADTRPAAISGRRSGTGQADVECGRRSGLRGISGPDLRPAGPPSGRRLAITSDAMFTRDAKPLPCPADRHHTYRRDRHAVYPTQLARAGTPTQRSAENCFLARGPRCPNN